MEKNKLKEEKFQKINPFQQLDDIKNKIKSEFILFLDDLLNVFPNNKNLFMCRIITHQIDKEEVCELLYNELYDYVNSKKNFEIQNIVSNEFIFNLNFLNHGGIQTKEDITISSIQYPSKNDITNGFQFKLSDLYNINNKDEDDKYREYNECIYRWIYTIVYLLKKLKTVKNI